MYEASSVEQLQNSGIDFERLAQEGIHVRDFAEQLMTSGLVLMDDVKWMAFKGHYGFAYLLKTLTCSPIPDNEADFQALVATYFPRIYDVESMIRSCGGQIGSLRDISAALEARGHASRSARPTCVGGV